MSGDEDFFPEWFRRRWRYPMPNLMDEFERTFEEMFKDLEIPKEMIRQKKLPSGGSEKDIGPFVYGYSFSVGPDGKPVVREFGNVKPSLRKGAGGVPKAGLDVREEREPLVDTIVLDDVVKVVAELPGVDKSDINLECNGKSLTLRVENANRKYFKQLDLPVEVDPDTSKASYKNGVLELVLTRKKPGQKPRQIRVD
jgi:HSP20 family protein